jgi:ABC-type transporter Mla subunit MlaD
VGAAIFEPEDFVTHNTHYFRIGLFVLTGFLLLAGALLAVGILSYFGKSEIFETCLPGKVENLSVGAPVKLRGVTIGQVSTIEFAGTEYPGYKEESVLVHFEVPKDFRWSKETNLQAMLDTEIGQGLRARVEAQGFIGASFLALEYVDPVLYPVDPIPWKPKHYYIPSAPSQFNRVLTSMEHTLRRIEDLDTADLLLRVQKLIDTANQLLANVNQINFNQLGTNASSLISDFRQTSQDLQHVLADAQGAIRNAEDLLKDARTAINGADLPTVSKDTAALEAKLSGAVADLRRVLSSVNVTELNDSLTNVRSATDELTVLLRNLREQPSSVLFSKPPKPTPLLETPPKK